MLRLKTPNPCRYSVRITANCRTFVWEWNDVGFVILLHYFFFPCVTLPHARAHVQICLSLFPSTSFFFISSDHISLNSSVNITS